MKYNEDMAPQLNITLKLSLFSVCGYNFMGEKEKNGKQIL